MNKWVIWFDGLGFNHLLIEYIWYFGFVIIIIVAILLVVLP